MSTDRSHSTESARPANFPHATDFLNVERLREALHGACQRILKSAEIGLFLTSGPVRLSVEERRQRCIEAGRLAEELSGLATDPVIEHFQHRDLEAILTRLRSIGLPLSGEPLRELNAAYFTARSAFVE